MTLAKRYTQDFLVEEPGERAVRHLIGERSALRSRTERRAALDQLDSQGTAKAPFARRASSRLHQAAAWRVPLIAAGQRFPDVSNNNGGNLNFAQIHAAHPAICFTKISEGTFYRDTYGPQRLKEMHDVGYRRRGLYHFFHPSESPEAQADFFLECAHSAGAHGFGRLDVIALDVEVSDGRSGWGNLPARFWRRLRWHGVKSFFLLYTGGPFAREFGVTFSMANGHWLPAYASSPWPYAAFGRKRLFVWQHTDGVAGPLPHTCPGVPGVCDMDVVMRGIPG